MKFNINISLGFCSILTLILITLKLTGYIGWSWWLVLMPLIAPILLTLIILILVFVFVAGVMLLAVLAEVFS